MEKILTTSSGRYKVLKLVQYVSKFLLLLSSHKRIRLSLHDRNRLARLVGQCSLQRRILQLGNLYKPLKALIATRKFAWDSVAGHVSALVEDLAEDIFTLAQLGWVPAHLTDVAVYADRAWLMSLLLDLRVWRVQKIRVARELQMERLRDQRPKSEEMARTKALKEQEWWLDLDGVRTMCDTAQAWCDVFEVQVFDGFVVGCALTSSVLGLYRFVAKPG